MRSALMSLLVFVSLGAAPAAAQYASGPYPNDSGPAVNPDGSLHWPTFYKSQQYQLNYISLWMSGSCRGTNPDITIPALRNRLNIDLLPEATVTGRVIRVSGGSVEIADQAGRAISIVTHPAGVSRVSVKGDAPAAALQPGMIVRFEGSVDERGEGSEPLSSLEVVSVPADFEYPQVEPGEKRTITARVVSLRRQLLLLQVDAGTLRRLKYQLADTATAHVDAKDLALSGVGDVVTATGRAYGTTDGKQALNLLFSSDVSVEKQAAVKAAAVAPLPRR